jgi:hypothetical protein
MIARTCQAVTLASEVDRYLQYLNTVVLPSYRRAEGNLNTYVLQEIQGDLAYIVLLSFWASWDALICFAGPDIEMAIQNPEEKNLLIAHESIARNYRVI